MKSQPTILFAAAAWILSYFAARYALDTWAPEPHWDIVVASIPVVAFYWFVWVVQRTLRNADELRRRIHLEALAIAFLTVVLAIMMLGLLEDSPHHHLYLPLRNLWLALVPIYGISFLVASRHYR
jgi:hypothetical protein